MHSKDTEYYEAAAVTEDEVDSLFSHCLISISTVASDAKLLGGNLIRMLDYHGTGKPVPVKSLVPSRDAF